MERETGISIFQVFRMVQSVAKCDDKRVAYGNTLWRWNGSVSCLWQ